MPIKAIIFDIDGVLADSRKAVAHNTKTLLREFGFIANGEEVEKMSRAHSADTVLRALAPSLSHDSELLKRMLRRLSELTLENLGMVAPLPLCGKIPGLSEKYLLGAATNRKGSAVLVLEKLGLRGYFAAVATSNDAPPKPDPKMIEIALGKLRVKPCDAVFVGDNIEDKRAGEAAGVRVVIVNGEDSASVGVFLREFLPES